MARTFDWNRDYIAHISAAAMQKYNERFDNELFLAATSWNNSPRANALIDEAMALCGHPRFALDPSAHWTDEELAFLNLFCEENK